MNADKMLSINLILKINMPSHKLDSLTKMNLPYKFIYIRRTQDQRAVMLLMNTLPLGSRGEIGGASD